ncbi:PepSY domain-containing protein [Shewanella eurypsychrophilus]|uniref:PepSY domain-containing protein n=1 Tax=Shewanella eurypsychrophilus TaxID=2593656 RepID=A0ABX6VCZ8_9GAMM|nr:MULTISPECIES: PepSY domain-containing protein [Shewanella]QPG60531.2 PepSY domain-containing protein [Shewanella eurypsychrophilus]
MKLASSTALVLITSTCLLFPLQGSASSVSNLSVVSALSSMGAAAQSKKPAKRLKVTSSQQAAQLVKRQYPGKVLKVQSSRVNGNPGYRVKLLSSSGAVFYVSVDAKTGSVRRN